MLEVQKLAKIIAGTNKKGGSGKTTTCEVVATALVKQGKKVLFVDLDPQRTGVYWWNRRVDFITEQLELAKSHYAIANLKRMLNLVATGCNPIEEGWDKFVDLITDNCTEYDYIIIDTPGHLENIDIQKNVFSIADMVLVPAKSTIEDLEQMLEMKDLIDTFRESNESDFKCFSVIWTYDKTSNAYNDYSILEKVKDTLPLLKFCDSDLVMRLKSSGLKASKVGCTAVEYGNDVEARHNIRRLGQAIINELE